MVIYKLLPDDLNSVAHTAICDVQILGLSRLHPPFHTRDVIIKRIPI